MSVLNWTRVGQMASDEVFLKVLLYGDSGAGKTHAGSTAPEPCYLLTEPNGLPTIRAANPDAVVVQADEGHGGMETVRAFLRAAKDGSLQRDTGAKTLVLDSLNELQRMLRDEIIATKRGTPAEDTFTLGDWGTLTDRMRGLVRSFRDLPMHVVAITHADVSTDDNSMRHVQPQFQGKALPNEIAGYFSTVGYVYRERAKSEDSEEYVTRHRVLLTGPPNILSKGLPGLDAVEDPNLSDWLTKLSQFDNTTKKPVAEAADPINKKPARRRRSRA